MAELGIAEDVMLKRQKTTESIGRLVINLEGILDGTVDDVNLKDGDILYVPEFNQEIAVIGEVQYPASHLYDSDLNVEEYLERSGGMTLNADKKRIYIVRADGSVSMPSSSGFFRNADNSVIQPGDTLVVPLDVTKMKPLTVWSEVTQVIYQLAIATAAVNSFQKVLVPI